LSASSFIFSFIQISSFYLQIDGIVKGYLFLRSGIFAELNSAAAPAIWKRLAGSSWLKGLEKRSWLVRASLPAAGFDPLNFSNSGRCPQTLRNFTRIKARAFSANAAISLANPLFSNPFMAAEFNIENSKT